MWTLPWTYLSFKGFCPPSLKGQWGFVWAKLLPSQLPDVEPTPPTGGSTWWTWGSDLLWPHPIQLCANLRNPTWEARPGLCWTSNPEPLDIQARICPRRSAKNQVRRNSLPAVPSYVLNTLLIPLSLLLFHSHYLRFYHSIIGEIFD